MVKSFMRWFYIPLLLMCSPGKVIAQIMPVDTTFYIEVEGARLFVRVVGSGQPLLVVHGGPGMSHDYLAPQLIESFKDAYQLIFYDQRASGKSSGVEDTSLIHLTQFVDDLERVRQHFKIDRLNLLGHSFGGLLAMYYSIAYADKVDKLLLVETSPASWEMNFPFFRKTVAERQTPEDKEELSAMEQQHDFGRNPVLMERYFKLYFATFFRNPSLTQNIVLGITENWLLNFNVTSNLIWQDLGKYDIYDKLPNITATTLVVHGDYSVLSLDGIKEIVRRIPKSSLVVLNEVGHFPYIEAPDAFSKTVKAFLRK